MLLAAATTVMGEPCVRADSTYGQSDTSLKWLQMHGSTFPSPEVILPFFNQCSLFSLSFVSIN